MEKRNIQISLEEAREWYNSGNSFKKELALKVYGEEELSSLNYYNIFDEVYNSEEYTKIGEKVHTYKQLLVVATYFNSIFKKEDRFQYVLSKYNVINKYLQPSRYKGFYINKIAQYPELFPITFNSIEAAKQTIDILGNKLNILFE